MRHCEDYIDDERASLALRAFLKWQRRPAIKKTGEAPSLFAVLQRDLTGQRYKGYWENGNAAMENVPLKAGQRVRVVMASRFGDVGVTPDLDAKHGYVARILVSDLDDFGA